MIVDTEKLVKQATFAKIKGVSRQRIGIMVAKQQLESVVIDGVSFIIIEKKQKKVGQTIDNVNNL